MRLFSLWYLAAIVATVVFVVLLIALNSFYVYVVAARGERVVKRAAPIIDTVSKVLCEAIVNPTSTVNDSINTAVTFGFLDSTALREAIRHCSIVLSS